MENASKALIIAGAILLSILIIALGIFIFNAAKGAVNTKQLDATEKQTFNAPIEQYEGRQIGSSVKQLIAELITNATTNADADERLPDILYVDSKSKGPAVNVNNIQSTVSNPNTNQMSTLRSKISSTHYYTIGIEYNEAGLVGTITINY